MERDERGGIAAPALTLWYTRCPVPTASSLAIANGWMDAEFAPDGIAVLSLGASEQRGVRESHFDHTRDNSFRQGGNIPPIWTRSRGGDVRLVALSWVDEYQAIVTLPGSGIRNVRDLRGRRLALPRRVNDQIDFWRAMCLRGYLSALALEGLDERDVELVDLPVEETYLGDETLGRSATLWGGARRQRRQQVEAFALIRGEVDAIYTSGAAGAQLAAFLGAHTVIDIGFHPDRAVRVNNCQPTAFTASGALCAERPDLVARYLARTLAAARWAADHPAETIAVVADEVGALGEWVVAASEPDFHTRLTLGLPDEWVAGIEAQRDFLLKWGFIADTFDVRDWIDPRPLEQARELVAAGALHA